MANVGTVTAFLTLNPTGFMAGLKAAETRLRAASVRMKRVGKSMTMGLSMPLLVLGGAIVKTASDYEAAMKKVSALTGALDEQGPKFLALASKARELGAATRYSAKEVADGMSFLAMAGFKADKIVASMGDTLNLAASANIDLATAADIVSNIMTGMRIHVDELGGAVDVLVKAFTSANTDLVQLGEAMKYAGPVASAFGQKLEDVVAMLGALGNAGIQGLSLIHISEPTRPY